MMMISSRKPHVAHSAILADITFYHPLLPLLLFPSSKQHFSPILINTYETRLQLKTDGRGPPLHHLPRHAQDRRKEWPEQTNDGDHPHH